MKTIGLIVNPVAGLGGRVGLKGSDTKAIQEQALALGAKPEALNRAQATLAEIADLSSNFNLLAAPGEMGAAAAMAAGFKPQVIGAIQAGATTPEDTIAIAKAMAEAKADLIVFAGGDGTARNIYTALGNTVPVLGIPAGVKIHSAVYAVNPKSAGRAIRAFLQEQNLKWREAEVMDIDEAAFRQGQVKAQLFGYAKVPELQNFMQAKKSGGYSEQADLAGIAAAVVAEMQPDTYYIIGPGTTTRSVMEALELPNSLLGIDVVQNQKLIAADCNEAQLYDLIAGKPAQIIVTVIGGQGHIFGRGNQQISPRVIRQVGKANITVIATTKKLFSILPRPLLVDTGDSALDAELSGYQRLITGYQESTMFQVGS